MDKWKTVLLGLAAFLTALAGGAAGSGMLGGINGRGNYQERTMLNAVAATSTGSAFNVADFVHIGTTVSSISASGTLKFACSMSETAPTFSNSQTSTNRYDYVEIVDLQNGSTIDGDTGIVMTNSSDVRQFEINTNNMRWCTAVLSPWTAGTTSVFMLPATNQ